MKDLNACNSLKWLLDKDIQDHGTEKSSYTPPYGDVTQLNTSRLILDSVGKEILNDIAEDAIDLLETSVAIYEVNGDYAFGMFSSGWCRFMDAASRALCQTDDNQEALECGKWLCHENCWNDSAKAAIMSGRSTDIECVGGINLYAEPIYAGGRVVGAINIGYGDPPKDPDTLHKLATTFHVHVQDLETVAHQYESRPPFMVALAKKRLKSWARLIGEIVEKTQAQKSLQESEHRYRSLFMSTLDGVCLHELVYQENVPIDYKILDVNPQYESILGIGRDVAIGKLATQVYGTDRAPFLDLYAHVVQTGEPHSFETYFEPWDAYFFISAFSPGSNQFATVFQDITNRKQTEIALKRSNARLREAQRIGGIGDWDWDPATNQVTWSKNLYLIFGLDPSQPPPNYQGQLDLYHSDDANRLDQAVTKALTDGTPYELEMRRTNPDGQVIHVLARGVAEQDESGQVIRLYGSVQDITERKRSEDELKEALAILQTAMDCSPAGIAIADANDGRLRYVNNAGLEIRGGTPKEVVNGVDIKQYVQVWNILHMDGTPYAEEDVPLARAIIYGQRCDEEFIIRRSDGDRIVWANAAPVRNEQGEVIAGIVVFNDVTAYKRAEEEKARLERQFQQSQRLESIGRLAGGVAHDLNNLLTPILGYTEMLLTQTQGNDPDRESLHEILSASRRARDLVQQLLALGRKQLLEFAPININSLVQNSYKLLRSSIRENVHIQLDLDSSSPFIQGDISQLEQVLMNLAMNAQDAMPDGGELVIETGQVELDQGDLQDSEGMGPWWYVQLVVRDTGQGMDATTREQVFEPFFTTKEIDKGTGLGLATVYGIVKQHGGDIRVDSTPDWGTTFKVYLPLSAEAEPVQDHGGAQYTQRHQSSETILVVEDDKQVRKLAAAALRREGYTVLTADSAHEAVDILKKRQEPVHLLLTDVVMPEMNGKELYEPVSAYHQNIKVLYMSGYTQDVIAQQGVVNESDNFIHKPFQLQELRAKVREVLSMDT